MGAYTLQTGWQHWPDRPTEVSEEAGYMRVIRGVPACIVLALLVILLSPLSPVTAGAAPKAAGSGLLELRNSHVEFSPDGNGRKDRARYRFALRRTATVTVTVRTYAGPGDYPVVRGPVRLGKLGHGRHAWSWDGQRQGGGVVADGYYVVRFVASRQTREGRRIARSTGSAHVDTSIAPGTLQVSQDTVHPTATVIDDAIVFTYTEDGYSGHYAEEAEPFTVRLEIRDAVGRTVLDRRVPVLATDVRQTTWYAHRTGGGVLPVGRYLARVSVEDRARNRRILDSYVDVDHRQLVEQVTDVGPFAASNYPTYDPPCYANGCGDPQYTPCSPVASDRFAQGLSFRSCEPSEVGSAETFRGYAPTDGLGPRDQYRIVATGGPTEPGEVDQGRLNGTPTPPGDGTTTSAWSDLNFEDHMYVRLGHDPIRWSFWAPEGNSYDVATFAVEYKHYVPVH